MASDDDVVFTLPKLQTILENDESEQRQEIKKQQDKGLNDEIDFKRLKDQIDSGEKITDIELLKDIEFYFGGPSPNFFFNVFKLEFK